MGRHDYADVYLGIEHDIEGIWWFMEDELYTLFNDLKFPLKSFNSDPSEHNKYILGYLLMHNDGCSEHSTEYSLCEILGAINRRDFWNDYDKLIKILEDNIYNDSSHNQYSIEERINMMIKMKEIERTELKFYIASYMY